MLAAVLALDTDIGNLPRIREILRTDTDAAFNGDPAAFSRDEVIVACPCIEAIAVQRLAHELYLENIPLIPRIMTEWAHSPRTGIDLHPEARIGTHFFIDHGTRQSAAVAKVRCRFTGLPGTQRRRAGCPRRITPALPL